MHVKLTLWTKGQARYVASTTKVQHDVASFQLSETLGQSFPSWGTVLGENSLQNFW